MGCLSQSKIVVFIISCMIIRCSADDLECYEGFGVFSPDVLEMKNSTLTKCPHDQPHVCLFADVTITVLGITMDVEVGTCLKAEEIPKLECDYLLQRFNQSGYIPSGLDLSQIDFSRCNMRHCGESRCNEFFPVVAATKATVQETTGGGSGSQIVASMKLTGALMLFFTVYMAHLNLH